MKTLNTRNSVAAMAAVVNGLKSVKTAVAISMTYVTYMEMGQGAEHNENEELNKDLIF